LLKHFRIAVSALALIVMAALVHGSGAAASVLADVAHAGEMASSQIGDTLSTIDEKFALSEPIYRDTDRGDAMLILALVLSCVVAFNLWLVRHLRCVYAPLR
jgi:hypothetical protein